ncbi:MAG: RagB/SusD family nutrient uptake outer membrane protein [Prevotella sp.]|nr:RagB/SusD family nutrient uptake outer membrane protein [Prevotella sp.]
MKYIINNIKTLFCGTMLLLAGGASLTSCTDWLDKDPDSIVAEDEAFKNFRNFQGYVEEIYSLIPSKEMVNYCTAWNFGDDAVHNPEGYAHMDHQVDLGNYRNWYTNTQCWLNGDRSSLWRNSWYSIRKCNLGIENIGSLIGTDEERDILLGQMYFFRAWWHFELMCYFGGLPYIDKTFVDGHIPELPRLSFQECARRCAEDFERAYNLLPLDPTDWDATLVAQDNNTKNNNFLRVNKFMALCYLGKCYLWAGSPLMKEFEKWNNGGQPVLLGASQGGANAKTYDYDEDFCKKAAEALGKALDMVNKGQVSYKLAEFKYANVYDHEELSEDLKNKTYSGIFYTRQDGWKMPGVDEAIFRGSHPGANSSNWNCAKIFGPKVAGLVEHDNIIHHPTGNLIDQYGMANGQPIYLVENGHYVYNPKSEWDPTHPFKGRDPRFYHDIVFDGFHYVIKTENLNDAQKPLEYCSLYTGGAMRSVDNGSSTGYFIQKLVPHQCNIGDKWYDYGMALQTYLPYMRLADVYLMFAEAMAAFSHDVKDLKISSLYCPSMSAVGAINALRDRVGMEGVQENFLDTREHFIDEVRRERAVELSFEGFRWNDLQRWLLLTEAPYLEKYSHEFERMQKDSWFKKNNPKDAEVANFHHETLIKRPLEAKHYWFPFPEKDVYLYEGFKQNPGW